MRVWGALNLAIFLLLQIKENHAVWFSDLENVFRVLWIVPTVKTISLLPSEKVSGTSSFSSWLLCTT